jgi:hypothetical protein
MENKSSAICPVVRRDLAYASQKLSPRHLLISKTKQKLTRIGDGFRCILRWPSLSCSPSYDLECTQSPPWGRQRTQRGTWRRCNGYRLCHVGRLQFEGVEWNNGNCKPSNGTKSPGSVGACTELAQWKVRHVKRHWSSLLGLNQPL